METLDFVKDAYHVGNCVPSPCFNKEPTRMGVMNDDSASNLIETLITSVLQPPLLLQKPRTF